ATEPRPPSPPTHNLAERTQTLMKSDLPPVGEMSGRTEGGAVERRPPSPPSVQPEFGVEFAGDEAVAHALHKAERSGLAIGTQKFAQHGGERRLGHDFRLDARGTAFRPRLFVAFNRREALFLAQQLVDL